jgi:nucleotide-binding universal stress UspA family protein
VYRNIVVAYDGSEGAEQALLKAVSLAEAFDGALQLVESTGHLQYAAQGVVPGAQGEAAESRRTLDEVADRFEGTHPVTRVIDGNPIQGIIGAAEEINADLIVMGSSRPRPHAAGRPRPRHQRSRQQRSL